MKEKIAYLILFIPVFLNFIIANAQGFVSINQNQIELNNGLVNRVISFPSMVNTSVNTTQFSLSGEILPFIATKNNEFSVGLNGETYTGNSAWQVLQCISITDSLHGSVASIQLKAMSGKAGRMGVFLERLKTVWGQMHTEGNSRFAEDIRPWERLEDKLKLYGRPFANSLCHVCSCATPVLALSKGVLGIQATAAGFTECTINPQLANLNWIKEFGANSKRCNFA